MRYSAYGIPIGLPAGDVNSDGAVRPDDDDIIADWIDTSHYDVRGDLNLDGVVDNTDRALLQARLGDTLGWNTLSLDVDHSGGGGGNRKGYAGYEGDFSRDGLWHVRHRVLESELGRWTRRDPLGYVDGTNPYQYTRSMALRGTDPSGTRTAASDFPYGPDCPDMFPCWPVPIHPWHPCGGQLCVIVNIFCTAQVVKVFTQEGCPPITSFDTSALTACHPPSQQTGCPGCACTNLVQTDEWPPDILEEWFELIGDGCTYLIKVKIWVFTDRYEGSCSPPDPVPADVPIDVIPFPSPPEPTPPRFPLPPVIVGL